MLLQEHGGGKDTKLIQHRKLTLEKYTVSPLPRGFEPARPFDHESDALPLSYPSHPSSPHALDLITKGNIYTVVFAFGATISKGEFTERFSSVTLFPHGTLIDSYETTRFTVE